MKLPDKLTEVRMNNAKHLTEDQADHYYRGFNDAFKELEPLIKGLKESVYHDSVLTRCRSIDILRKIGVE